MSLISRDYLVLVLDVKCNKIFEKENHLGSVPGHRCQCPASVVPIALAAALQHRTSNAHR